MPQGIGHNDPGPPASAAPSDPPASARRARPWVRCARALSVVVRRPGRTAAVVVLVGLIGLAVWMAGVQAWGFFDLRAARAAVEHYHNRQAREYLQAYLGLWPRDPDALLLAARTARRVGTYDDAEQFLDRYEAVRGKDDDDLILERVLVQAARGRVDRVSDYCETRVRENHPSAPLILEAQAVGLMRLYRIGEAADRLQAWLKLRPDDCQALLLQGILEDLQDHTNDAIAKYRRVAELDPDNEDARMRLTGLLLMAHEPGEALPHLQYLLKVMPHDPRVLTRIARCRADMGQPDEAKRILDGVLARYPQFPDALDERGLLALQDGDYAAAEGWLRGAAARDRGSVETRYHLIRCLTSQGKDAEVKEQQARLDALEADLKEINDLVNGKIQHSPHDPALQTRAGEIALRVGAGEDGVRWLENALELDPNYAPAHEALAQYYQEIGDHGRAAEHLAAAKAAGRGRQPGERGPPAP